MTHKKYKKKVGLLIPLVCGLLAVTGCEKKDDTELFPVLPGHTLATTELTTLATTEMTVSMSIEEVTTEQTTEDKIVEPIKYDVTMNFVGDLLLATNEGQSYENCFRTVAESVEPTYFLENFSDMFLNDSITIGDCENVFTDNDSLPISDKGQEQAKLEYEAAVAAAEAAGEPKPENTFRAFWFRSKAVHANILSAGGVDVVSIDNNHINDYGPQGKEDTKAALDAAGVLWGAKGKVVYKQVQNFNVALVFGSMYNEGAVSSLLADLEEAKLNSDYQVVYFHGGTEKIHEPESWKQSACHTLADNGADLVIGDHPHVLQPLEQYNGVNIIYSLGNFVFGGNKHPENRTIVFSQTLSIEENPETGDKSVVNTSYEMIPCYVYVGEMNNWQPAIIEDEAAASKVLDFMNGLVDSPL